MKRFIRKTALELGFGACGVTTAEPVDCFDELEAFVASGRCGSMRWLERDPRSRLDPSSLLAGAKSVICCALGYGENGCHSEPKAKNLVDSTGSFAPLRMTSKVARFARGADYHDVVREKLEALWYSIFKEVPDRRAKICVDTSPILEKALAQRAGLGWIGKHTVLVSREFGSWFVLGEIITDLDIEPDDPARNLCGDCCACIDACPTKALVKPHALDSRQCISYLTIEAPRLRRVTSHGFSYGCDVCQEVCPHNP